ncbi:hypothetical protein BJX96DRAFT_135129 [Aspergillus floccosus]
MLGGLEPPTHLTTQHPNNPHRFFILPVSKDEPIKDKRTSEHKHGDICSCAAHHTYDISTPRTCIEAPCIVSCLAGAVSRQSRAPHKGHATGHIYGVHVYLSPVQAPTVQRVCCSGARDRNSQGRDSRSPAVRPRPGSKVISSPQRRSRLTLMTASSLLPNVVVEGH